MSRICYFKQHGATGLALAADLTTLEGVVNNKAAANDLTALEGVVDGKADAADLTTLSGIVDGKAASVDVYTKTATDALLDDKLVAGDIADKVDSSYLGQVVNDINDALGNRAQVNNVYTKTATDALLDDKADASALASKLDTSVHDARVSAENLFYVAMGESLYLESAVGSGTEFSYTGLIGA